MSLKSLRDLKRFTPYHTRKNFAEALVLSKLDYANARFYNIPKYLQNHTQRIQNATSSFVNCKYVKETDVLTLNWLPLRERIAFSRSSFPEQNYHSKLWILMTG